MQRVDVLFVPQLVVWSLVRSLLRGSVSNAGGAAPFEPGRGGRGPSPIMEENAHAVARLSWCRRGQPTMMTMLPSRDLPWLLPGAPFTFEGHR
jgi:hypothetical protein